MESKESFQKYKRKSIKGFSVFLLIIFIWFFISQTLDGMVTEVCTSSFAFYVFYIFYIIFFCFLYYQIYPKILKKIGINVGFSLGDYIIVPAHNFDKIQNNFFKFF